MKKTVKVKLIIIAMLSQLFWPCMAFADDAALGEEPIPVSYVMEEALPGSQENQENQELKEPQVGGATLPEIGDNEKDDESLQEEGEEVNPVGAEGASDPNIDVTQTEEVEAPIDGGPGPYEEIDDQQHGDEETRAVPQELDDLEGEPNEVVLENASVEEDGSEPKSPAPLAAEKAAVAEQSAEKRLADRYRDAIKDGVYVIESSLKKGLVLDLHNTSEDNYVNVEMRDSSDDLRQRWYVEHDADGYLSFINMLTGKALDVYGGNASPRENVQQYKPNGTKAQKWIAVPSEKRGGTFQIVSALNTGLAIDVYDGRTKSGTNVWVYRDNGTAAQCFSFLPAITIEKQQRTVEDGIYSITTVINDDYALNISDTSPNAQLGSNIGTDEQLVYISYNNGYYRIQDIESNYYLDTQDHALEPRSNACQSKGCGSASQEWSIVREGSFFRITNRASGLALDVYDGKAFDGANVWLYQNNSSNAQAWNFKPYQPLSDGECYAITSSKNARYGIEVREGSSRDGANVQLSLYDGAFSEKWIAHRNGDGSYSFESLASGLYLAASSGNVCQQKNQNTFAAWRLVPTKHGFNFAHVATGLLMDINSGRMAEGTNVKLWKNNGGAAQRFFMREVPLLEERTYAVRLAGTNKLVDVRSGRKTPGTAIQLFHDNGSNAQMWTVINNYDGTTSFVSERSGLAMSWGTDCVTQEPAGGGRSLQHRWILAPNGNGTFALVSTDGSNCELSAESNKDRATMVMSPKGSSQYRSFILAEASPREGKREIDQVKRLSFSDGNAVLIERGTQRRLAVDISPRLARQGEVCFSSADPTIVKVSSNGSITALRPGTTTVTVQLAGDNKSRVTCEVTVSETKGQITNEMLEMIERSSCNELMVVAHPDDETFWGGAHLIEGNYLVICLTNGANPVRRNEFNKAMDVSGSQRIILSYPDTDAKSKRDQWTNCKEGLFNDLLAVLSIKNWNTVATHNQDGDTGHIHHKMTNEMVTSACQIAHENVGAYYNFGTFYNAKDRRIDQVTPNVTGQLLEKKMRMVACYQAEQGAYRKYWAQMMPHEHWKKVNF